MADINLTEGLKKIFLAGVGAVATGAEKTDQVVNDLVKKGELTVEQGKALNEELKRTVKENVSPASDDDKLRTKLEGMSAEERSAYAAKVAEIAADIDATVDADDVE